MVMMVKEKLKVAKVHVEGEEYSQTRYIYSQDGVDVMAALEKAFPQPDGGEPAGEAPKRRGKGKRQPKTKAPVKAGA